MFFYTINSNLYLSKALLRGKDWKWCQCQRLICLFVCFLKKCNNDTNNVQSSFFFLIHHFSWLDTALSFVFINWCYSNSLHWLFHFPIAIRTKWHHKWKKGGDNLSEITRVIDFPSSLHKQLEMAYVWKSAKWHTSEEGIFNPNLQKAFAQHGFKRMMPVILLFINYCYIQQCFACVV